MDRLEPPELARQARARVDAFATGLATSAKAPLVMPESIARARARTAAFRPRDFASERRRPIDPR